MTTAGEAFESALRAAIDGKTKRFRIYKYAVHNGGLGLERAEAPCRVAFSVHTVDLGRPSA